MTYVKEIYEALVNGHEYTTEQLLDLINDVVKFGKENQVKDLAYELEHCYDCFTEMKAVIVSDVAPHQDGYSVCPSCGNMRD